MRTEKEIREIKKRFETLEDELRRAFDSSTGNMWYYHFFRRFNKLKRMVLKDE